MSRRLRAVNTALATGASEQKQPDGKRYRNGIGEVHDESSAVPGSESLVSRYEANLRPEPYAIPSECARSAPPQLLSDHDVQRFIVDGFLKIETPFAGQPVHETICEKIDGVIDKMGNPGNNLLATVPDIQRVFDHPNVRGAVQSLLGPDAFLHPHIHCHNHQPGAGDQSWHKVGPAFSPRPCAPAANSPKLPLRRMSTTTTAR